MGTFNASDRKGLHTVLRLLLATTASLVLAACGGAAVTSTAEFDGPVYENLDDLEESADVVVRGTVLPGVSTFVDTGGEPAVEEAGQSVEQRASEVRVDDYLLGSGPPELIVVQPDMDSDQVTPLVPGEEVVLWLKEESEESAPSAFAELGRHWYPLGLDQGIADIVDGDVVPRDDRIESLSLQDLEVRELDG